MQQPLLATCQKILGGRRQLVQEAIEALLPFIWAFHNQEVRSVVEQQLGIVSLLLQATTPDLGALQWLTWHDRQCEPATTERALNVMTAS